MYELREALAAVLGVLVGVLFVAYPGLVARLHTVGRMPRDRGGRWGDPGPVARDDGGDQDEGENGSGLGWLLWLFRGVGALFVLGGLYFAARPFLF